MAVCGHAEAPVAPVRGEQGLGGGVGARKPRRAYEASSSATVGAAGAVRSGKEAPAAKQTVRRPESRAASMFRCFAFCRGFSLRHFQYSNGVIARKGFGVERSKKVRPPFGGLTRWAYSPVSK